MLVAWARGGTQQCAVSVAPNVLNVHVECLGVGGPLDHGGVVPSARKGYDGLVFPELAFFRKAKTGFTRLRTYSFADAPSYRGREVRHIPANFC